MPLLSRSSRNNRDHFAPHRIFFVSYLQNCTGESKTSNPLGERRVRKSSGTFADATCQCDGFLQSGANLSLRSKTNPGRMLNDFVSVGVDSKRSLNRPISSIHTK